MCMPVLICVVSHVYMCICVEYVHSHVCVCAYPKCILSLATGWSAGCSCSCLTSVRLLDLAWFPLTPYRSLSNMFLQSLGMGGSAANSGAWDKQKGWKASGPSLLCFRFCHFMLMGDPLPMICECVSLSRALCVLWIVTEGLNLVHFLLICFHHSTISKITLPRSCCEKGFLH